jgi:4-alpha-glucanotransferase
MPFPRSSGVLLHPTSLPGRYGIGDLGEWAYRFVDWLEAAGQTYWQVLPLGPTSYGDSPYQSLSTFAGNPLLISLDKLVDEGWLTPDDIADVPEFPDERVDFGAVIDYHNHMLSLAYGGFEANCTDAQKVAFEAWCNQHAVRWLDDFSLFVALKDFHGGRPWVEWPTGESLHDEEVLAQVRRTHAKRIAEQQFRQWVFHAQWWELKTYAGDRGIRLIGDIPIFVAHDSADVWGNRHLYYLDKIGNPTVVAGVPPDYFSETGQRWGNPLYRWDVMAEENYRWWIDRIKAALSLVDIVRIDHFRGFEGYWEIPATEPTAVKGRWVPGPAMALFDAVRDALEELPIIAEDLGVITPGVVALRDGLKLPGMKILQFAFGGECGEDPFLPHNYVHNCVVYSGTHDNNTTVGWWESGEATEEMLECMEQYIGHSVTEPHWDLIRLGMMSVAHTFIVPLQDLFGLGEDSRMNLPGREMGNWGWRFTADWLEHPAHERLAEMTRRYSRWPETEDDADET